MGLDVRLVDHVQAVLVAQVVEPRIVGIVGTAHGVHVMLLHQVEVATHRLLRQRPAVVGVELVAVHPEDRDGLAVDQQLVVAHLHRTEADALGPHLGHRSVGRAQRDDGAVELGRFVVPRGDPGNLDAAGDHRAGPDGARDQLRERFAVFEDRHLRCGESGESAAAKGRYRKLHRPARLGRSEVHAHLDLEGARGPVRRKTRREGNRPECRATGRDQPHRAVQSGQPPLVLILEPRRGRPLGHEEFHLVGPPPQSVGDVERGGQTAVGAAADPAAVHRHRDAAVGAADLEQRAATAPPRRHRERPPVDARRVVLGHRRRIRRERHDHVGVARRSELERLAALQHPRAGHLDGRPALTRHPREPELPGAVEGPHPRRRLAGVSRRDVRIRIERGRHRQAADSRDLGRTPELEHRTGATRLRARGARRRGRTPRGCAAVVCPPQSRTRSLVSGTPRRTP